MCLLSAFLLSKFNYKSFNSYIFGFIYLLTIMVTMLTGERMNFIILVGTTFLAALFWKPKLINILVTLILIITVALTFLFKTRFI